VEPQLLNVLPCCSTEPLQLNVACLDAMPCKNHCAARILQLFTVAPYTNKAESDTQQWTKIQLSPVVPIQPMHGLDLPTTHHRIQLLLWVNAQHALSIIHILQQRPSATTSQSFSTIRPSILSRFFVSRSLHRRKFRVQVHYFKRGTRIDANECVISRMPDH
jgi:hypothetical protein